jgi:hypothetical protein
MQPTRQLTQEEIAEGQRGIRTDEFTATQVQALVRRMDVSKRKWRHLKQRSQPAYEEALQKENEELYFNFPSLFHMHAEDRLDSTFFEMIQLKRKMEKGEMTAEQASAIVGQKLFNRFVPHVLSNSPAPAAPMSYEDYYRETQ